MFFSFFFLNFGVLNFFFYFPLLRGGYEGIKRRKWGRGGGGGGDRVHCGLYQFDIQYIFILFFNDTNFCFFIFLMIVNFPKKDFQAKKNYLSFSEI